MRAVRGASLTSRTPPNHSKPNIQAALAVYYAALISGEPLDLNECEEEFHRSGVSVDVLRTYINGHNRDIRASDAPEEVKELLTASPRLGDPRTRSFTIEGIQLEIPPGISVEAAHDWYMHEINGTVERIAARLEKEIPGFRLKRSGRDPNMFSGEVIQRHIAFENHPIAQAVPEGFKFEVKDPVDGKPRIIVDHSHGPPELETVHNKLSLDDMVQLQANTFVLATNDLKEVFAEVGRVQSTGQDQLDQLRETVQMLVTGKLGGNPV